MRLIFLLIAFVATRDAADPGVRRPASSTGSESLLAVAPRPRRGASWADALDAVDVTNVLTRASARIRLYADDGSIDAGALDAFARVSSPDPENVHALASRLVQLVVKAAHHFERDVGGPKRTGPPTRVRIVSAWRAHAGRHGTGEALDFKLDGVRAAQVAAYLRQLARVGVGVYTNARTQFVHLDVRDESYHWVDASPPGVKWREAMLRDPGAKKRDAAWTPADDLP
ncbi:MAG: DUF882 domain-containing protein [Polyangiaceae bacterium]|jgi:hypothetical protein